MYVVTKKIDFCYGHRLLEYEGNCRHLHGHNGIIEIDLARVELDRLGMVVDFAVIRDALKTWITANLDHRLLLCKRDPFVGWLREQGEPIYVMDENPTAENIARLVYEQARQLGLPAVEVRLWETPTSCATYRES